jgi:large subunit ribosomal protein L25
MARTIDALPVETRTQVGTTRARALRRTGKIPGVLFGHGAGPLAISLDGRAFEELLHGGGRRALLTIKLDGKTTDTALLRAVQRDPVTRRVLHADLQRVGRSESISSAVPIVAVGAALGVRDFGGVLDVVTHELSIVGPADQIPEHLEIDVTNLGLRDHITAGDIALPPGFTLETPPDTVVVAVEPSRTAVEVEEAAPAPAASEVPTVAETESETES